MVRKCAIILVVLLSLAFSISLSQERPAADLATADALWNEGNYAGALTAYLKLLSTGQPDSYLEPIAFRTGEWFVTEEITNDGRNPRLSPDGKWISYEFGPAKNPQTRIVSTTGSHSTAFELAGTNAVFSPDNRQVAYVRIPASDDLVKAQEEVDKQTEPGPERTYAQQVLNRLQAVGSRIVLHPMDGSPERELETGDHHLSEDAAGRLGSVCDRCRREG